MSSWKKSLKGIIIFIIRKINLQSISYNISTFDIRFAIDLGVPIINMDLILNNVVENAGKTEELSHSFFLRVRDMILAGDGDGLIKEKVHTKLLRLSAQANNGFVLLNFPNDKSEAEVLESYKGGLNAFVHVSLPDDILVDIEENKLICGDCGR